MAEDTQIAELVVEDVPAPGVTYFDRFLSALEDDNKEPDVHNQQCPTCGTVWKHDRAAIPAGKYNDAHTCPIDGCGGRDTLKRDIGMSFSSDRPPAYCHNGARTIARDTIAADIRLMRKSAEAP